MFSHSSLKTREVELDSGKQTLEKTDVAIKNGQSRDTGIIEHKKQREIK
jgi:hypothetical protein